MRGTVQYEREMGGLVGQQWRLKQRGVTTIHGGGASGNHCADGGAIVIVAGGKGCCCCLTSGGVGCLHHVNDGLLTSWIAAGCTRESGDLTKFSGMFVITSACL